MPASPDISREETPTNAANRRAWGRGLFFAGLFGLAAVEAYYAFTAQVRDPIHLQLGMVMLLLAGLPCLLWAKRGRASLPIFETLMLTTANAYALPLLNGHHELIFYRPDDITSAAFAIVLFQLAALAAYEVTGGRPSLHPFWREEVVSDDLGRWLTYGMALNTIYTVVSRFTEIVPAEIASVLRAIFFGIGIICTFISSRRLGEGRLAPGERFFFLLNLLLQAVAMVSTLYLVGAISTLLLALVGYVSGSGRIPFVTAGVILFSLAILHHGKPEMRKIYWGDHAQPLPTASQLPGFYSEWIRYGLKHDRDDDEIAGKLIERTSLFHLMCLVVSVTPSTQPFLEGETYRDIPAQFVPRLLWPDKPLGHVSTSKLSVYYGLQTEEETLTTTIGFGMVTEAFANFGWWGVAALGAVLGFCIKKFQRWGLDSPLFSYGGLILVILLAWSFQVEFTLSIWLASLYQACVAVLLIPFALRKILGR
jgi:hypothetical protein